MPRGTTAGTLLRGRGVTSVTPPGAARATGGSAAGFDAAASAGAAGNALRSNDGGAYVDGSAYGGSYGTLGTEGMGASTVGSVDFDQFDDVDGDSEGQLLVNVNSRLVPESTVLRDGDLVMPALFSGRGKAIAALAAADKRTAS